MNEDLRIKVVAIAKDEAAYLAEWIHHHLYFGFDCIELYVNRTTDNSYKILDQLIEDGHNIAYQQIDWLNLCQDNIKSSLQSIAYAHAIGQARLTNDCTHILFIDIDEYWMPINFKSTIHDSVRKLKKPDAISFEWLIQFAEETEFSPLPCTLEYSLNHHIKTLVNIHSPIRQVSVHSHIFNTPNVRHVLADGTPYMSRTENDIARISSSISSLKECAVLHRMFKSEVEYLAALYRGNPETSSGLKLNRPGYIRPPHNAQKILIDDEAYARYTNSLNKFLYTLTDELEIAKDTVRKRANLAIESVVEFGIKYPEKTREILSGVTHPEVKNKILELDHLLPI